jgi:hypothetical protein
MKLKIRLQAYNLNKEPITLLLDKETSFVFKKSKLMGIGEGKDKTVLKNIVYISLSTHTQQFFIVGIVIDVINNIEDQIAEILANEKSALS